MSLTKGLLIGTGLLVLASLVSAKENWGLFEIGYVSKRTGEVTGIYSCRQDDVYEIYCEKVSKKGDNFLGINHSRELSYFSNSKESAMAPFSSWFYIKSLGKPDLTKFINETSP